MYLTIRRRQRNARKGGSAQDPSGKIMAPWTFDIKFPLGSQFTFGSLTIATGEDGELRMLPPGPAPEHRAPADGQVSWSLTTSSTSGGGCSSLDPFAGLYICTAKIVRGIPVMTSTLWPLAEASSSSSLAASPDQDSSDDYPEIGGKCMRGLRHGGSPHLHGGPEWGSVA
jgi:hypothetical protein